MSEFSVFFVKLKQVEELEVKQLSLLQTSFGENWCKNSAKCSYGNFVLFQ